MTVVSALAAAELLVTAEHDRKVAARAWSEAVQATADAVWAEPGRPRWDGSCHPTPTASHVERATRRFAMTRCVPTSMPHHSPSARTRHVERDDRG